MNQLDTIQALCERILGKQLHTSSQDMVHEVVRLNQELADCFVMLGAFANVIADDEISGLVATFRAGTRGTVASRATIEILEDRLK